MLFSTTERVFVSLKSTIARLTAIMDTVHTVHGGTEAKWGYDSNACIQTRQSVEWVHS